LNSVEFPLYVSYSQLAVLDPGEALNMWTEQHCRQGFSWRPGSVSFATLSEAAQSKVRVILTPDFTLAAEVVRSVAVPYVVGQEGVEIVSVTEGTTLAVPPGSYQLVFSAIRSSEGEVYEIHFVPEANPIARILRADEALNPDEALLMTAEPAM
jgi:hypothetical protein